MSEPFPIQSSTLPDALAGRDVCGRAPTGSGKTLAYGIPLVARVGRARARRPRALVLVPTRELATQVSDQLAALAAGSDRSVLAVYGGAGMQRQIQRLASGAEVVVATPGRLRDLVDRGDARLDEVDLVVVDEADRMADMGFLPEVRRLLDEVRPDRQTLLFSATLDGDVDVLVTRYQRQPRRHEVATPVEQHAEVEHRFWRVEAADRTAVTADIVRRRWPAIVFCRTKHGADRVARNLTRAGIGAVAIHGDRSQAQRERALAAFTSGAAEVLVATDVAARGIHVDGVACVVQLDPPATAKDYVHRAGRTGRAGADGLAITLVTAAREADVRAIRRELSSTEPITEPELELLGGPTAPAGRTDGTRRSQAARAGARGDRSEGTPSSGGPRRPRRRGGDAGADRPQRARRAGRADRTEARDGKAARRRGAAAGSGGRRSVGRSGQGTAGRAQGTTRTTGSVTGHDRGRRRRRA